MTTWAVFLGGHDLEMVAIAELLAPRGDVELHDRRLAWGAKASDHLSGIRDALGRDCRVVLVELIDDLPADLPRERLTWIDHHGPLAGVDRPTAIEQVFQLLDFPPDRWTRDLTLVAANDRGHVRGLRRAGATADEIRSIRDRDRQAQGITPDEERIGREAIRVAESHFGGRLTVVRLPHTRTATVTDPLDPALGGPGYENLVVFCPTETVFFGSGRCIAALRAAHPDGWFGGELPERGFWGVARPLPEPDLFRVLESPVVSTPAPQVVIEKFHHILVWPLILRGGEPDDIASWITALTAAGWRDTDQPGSTGVADDIDYREVVYFHPFARDFLYADGYHTPDARPVRRLKRADVPRVTVTTGKHDPLDLKVERAELYLCKPNVLLFCLEVSNRGPDGAYAPLMLDVIHDFRDQFRRVHPPFFYGGDGPDATGAGLSPAAVQWAGLSVPAGCTLTSPKKEFDEFTRQGAEPPVFAHWRVWFGDAIRPLPRLIVKGNPNGLYYQQIMDERMQCLSYLAAADPSEITDGDRDRLTFVDAAGTDPFPYNPAFLEMHRPAHTYARFDSPEYQTAYFFCSYAFTAVGRAKDPFYSHLVIDHFRRMYYRMGVTAHYQRAALLYFADEMSTAAKMLAGHSAASEAEHRNYRDKLFAVQMQFIKFRSRSYFPEMTNQLQGQEMNRLWHTHLGIRELFDQVDDTCDQINEVFTQRAAERLSGSQEKLSRIAAIFLPVSIALSLLSVLFASDLLPKYLKPHPELDTPTFLFSFGLGVMALAGLTAWLLWRWKWK